MRHIKKVLRLKENEHIVVCDGKGYDYDAVISELDEKEIICTIAEKYPAQTEPDIRVTLYQGLPKASKMDYIIQKNTELGISQIVPCELNRCVVRLEDKKAAEKKTERWQKISGEAAKQSGRGVIPKISMPMTLDAAIEKMKGEVWRLPFYDVRPTARSEKSLPKKKDVKTSV